MVYVYILSCNTVSKCGITLLLMYFPTSCWLSILIIISSLCTFPLPLIVNTHIITLTTYYWPHSRQNSGLNSSSSRYIIESLDIAYQVRQKWPINQMVQSIKKWPTMFSHHAFLHLKDSKCIQISCIRTCQGENVYEDSYMFTIYRKKKKQ